MTPEQKRCFAIKTAEYRCRRRKTYEKEETCAARAIPKSTLPDINKWADFFMIGEELDFLNCNGRWSRAVSPLNIMICSMFSPWKFRLQFNGCFIY